MMPKRLPNGSRTAATLMPSPTSVTGFDRRRAERDQAREGGVDVGHAPQRLRPCGAGLALGQQAEFEAADREADIERLVEIRRLAEHLGVPALGGIEVGDGIDRSAQAEDHGMSFDAY